MATDLPRVSSKHSLHVPLATLQIEPAKHLKSNFESITPTSGGEYPSASAPRLDRLDHVSCVSGCLLFEPCKYDIITLLLSIDIDLTIICMFRFSYAIKASS